jgi:hypothetical protein
MLATEMLMPRGAFLDYAGGCLTIDQIFRLASVFGTSMTSTALRCAELLRVSVFEVQEGSVVWSYGAVSKGPIRFLDSDLQRLIADGVAGGHGDVQLRLVTRGLARPWRIEYRGMKENRALFLLRPEASRVSLAAS